MKRTIIVIKFGFWLLFHEPKLRTVFGMFLIVKWTLIWVVKRTMLASPPPFRRKRFQLIPKWKNCFVGKFFFLYAVRQFGVYCEIAVGVRGGWLKSINAVGWLQTQKRFPLEGPNDTRTVIATSRDREHYKFYWPITSRRHIQTFCTCSPVSAVTLTALSDCATRTDMARAFRPQPERVSRNQLSLSCVLINRKCFSGRKRANGVLGWCLKALN